MIRRITQTVNELYRSRSLMLGLSQKDFQKKYAGSVFGILWAFVQPSMTILIYWFAFQFGFRSPDFGEIPFVLWFLAAMVPWLFISEAITASSSCFLEYSYLVKKVVFHIDLLPMVKIMSSFMIHVSFVLLVQMIYIIFGIFPTLKLIQILYYAICAIAFTFSISLIFSSIIVFFRDLGQIIQIILLVGMWVTPIAWNIDYFSGTVQFLLKLNPVYYIVEGYRDSFIGRMWFFEKIGITIYFWVCICILLSVGTALFHRLKPHFADVL